MNWKLIDNDSKFRNKYSGLLFLYNSLSFLLKIKLTENQFQRSPISLLHFENES